MRDLCGSKLAAGLFDLASFATYEFDESLLVLGQI